MNAEPFDRPRVPFNPAMLRWAREWRGRSVAEAAHRVGRSEAVVLEWENPEGNSAPTVRQARILADFYERPFLEFFAATIRNKNTRLAYLHAVGQILRLV